MWVQKIIQKIIKAYSSFVDGFHDEKRFEVSSMDTEKDFGVLEEVEEPESLKRKWEAEALDAEWTGPVMRPCPWCGQLIESQSFSCLYCGKRVLENSGPLGNLLQFFRQQSLAAILLLFILILGIFSVLW